MKLFALLFLVGLAAATGEWEWKTGKEYVFEYKGRLITGFPKLTTQYSGMGVWAKVVMKVLQPDHVLMLVEEPRSVEVNNILKPKGDSYTYGPEGTNWRHLELPSAQPVPEEYRRILSKPVAIRFAHDGEVISLTFETEEPEWSVNFKKGIVSLFQTKVSHLAMELEENRLEELSWHRNTTNVWKISEQSIDGICENQYSLSELPKFYIKEHPESVPFVEACEDPKRLFRITKLRNTDNCEKRSLFSFFKPGYFNCRGEMGANCSPMWSRSSYTTYIACLSKDATPMSGDLKGRLVIQSVVNEAELSSYLLGYSTEKITTGNSQVLKLREIRHSPGGLSHRGYEHGISSPRTVTSLLYEFNKDDLVHHGQSKHVDTRSVLMNPAIVSRTNQHLFAKGAGVHVSKEEIIGQIVELLREVARDLESSSGTKIIEAHINMKLIGVAKGMALLEESGMFMDIYRKIHESVSGSEKVSRIMLNLFFDTVTISGTPVAVEFIKDMMKSGKMSMMQKAQFFMWMPQHLVAPTTKVLHSLVDLVKSEAILGGEVSPVIRGLAYSSVSRLIHLACISEDRLNSYPTWVYGEFCSPDSEIVFKKWVPFLVDRLYTTKSKTERDIVIMSMGVVAKKTVIPYLVNIIEKWDNSAESMKMGGMKPASTSRLLAIYSLVSVGYREPQLVTPILMAILKDPSEPLEMRVAAFNGLMKMGPPSVYILHDIVGMTHQETGIEMELLKVINTGLYSAGHQELHPNMEFERVEMIKNAKMAYHMVRKVKGIYPTSATFFFNTFLEKLDIGYEGFLTYILSQESFLPKHIYAEMKYLLVNFNLKPFQFGATFGSGSTNDLHKKLAAVFASKEKLQEAVQEHLSAGLNHGWKKIVEQLKEEQVEDMASASETEYEAERRDRTSIFIKLFETSFLYFSFDSLTSSPTIKHVVKELFHLRGQIGFDNRVEFQRVMDIVPIMVTIPSDMGFPINVRLHHPMTFSFSGDVRAKLTAGTQSLDISGKMVFASQLTGFVGTVSPFTRELIATGVDQHSVIDLPGVIRIKADIPEHKLTVEFGKIETRSEPVIDVAHFHVIPFTTRQKLTSLQPLVKSEHFKSIGSDIPEQRREMTVGEVLGLKLKLNYKTESAFRGLSDLWELLWTYKCPLNMMAFDWISPAIDTQARSSLRKHKFTVALDTTESATKEIRMEFKLGYSTLKSGSPIQYHKIQVLESELASGSEMAYYLKGIEGHESPALKTIKKYLPYRINLESLEASVQASHPRRAEKLREVLEKLVLREEEKESASAISLITSITLMGSSRPRTISYSVAVAFGSNYPYSRISSEVNPSVMSQKWSIKMEGFYNRHLCINGRLSLPILPMWNVNDLKSTLNSFELKNILATGESDCSESSIETVGRFIASERQYQIGLKSPEAELCLKLSETHGHSRHSVCKRAIDLATSVDVVEIENKFKNVRPFITKMETKIVDFLKGYLWPYLKVDKKINSSYSIREESMPSTYETKAKIEFHPETPSFDLVVKGPVEELYFENIHILSPYRIFFPLKTGRRFGKVYEKAIGHGALKRSEYKSRNSYYGNGEYEISEYEGGRHGVYYRCMATPESVTTYKNTTVSYKNHYGCEHLLTGDCGEVKNFFVSEVINKDGKNKVKIHLRDAKVEIVGEEQNRFIMITVDGKVTRLFENVESDLKDATGKKIGTFLYRKSSSRPLKIMLPRYNLDAIYFDTRKLEVVPSPTMKEEQMCGICGTLRSHRMPPKSQICEYSTPELTVASNRVGLPSDACPSLEQPLKEQLRREKEICRSRSLNSPHYRQEEYKAIHHFNKNFQVAQEECSVLKHVIKEKHGKICFSKIPLLHCGLGCKAGQHVEKEVPFVCMPRGRMADYYVQKVEEGRTLSELYSMEESYVKEIRQVQHCVVVA